MISIRDITYIMAVKTEVSTSGLGIESWQMIAFFQFIVGFVGIIIPEMNFISGTYRQVSLKSNT